MFRTLRSRFIVSHILPVLILAPLMGITLIYVLETQLMVAGLTDELTQQAVLIAEIVRYRAGILYDHDRAQALLALMDPQIEARVMIVDANGRLLASSDPDDEPRLGKQVDTDHMLKVPPGQISVLTSSRGLFSRGVIDVVVPVVRSGEVSGAVMLSHQLSDATLKFTRLRYVIVGVVVGGLVVGAALGLVLAVNLERPLGQITTAVYQLTAGDRSQPLEEQDPTEIRLLARSVNSLVDQMQSLEQARRQLLANLVHELGRPLGALRSAIEALLRGADEDEALRHELLVGMEGEIDLLEHVLEDLAGLYDSVAGTIKLEREPTVLSEWLSQMLGPWRAAAQAKGLHWAIAVPDTLPTVLVDPRRLGQTLGNLLSNAIKYTAPDGTVSVDAGVGNQLVWIRIGDTGPGIPLEEQERIFAPLYRAQADRRFPQGMGLGLAIARDIAVAHGGRIDVESTPGEGSRFTLWLPTDLNG
jgi:signal transduction histidine kinase